MSEAKRKRDRMMPKSQFASYPKKLITEIIEIYKNSPELWKVKSEEYFDRAKKDRAYALIIDKFQEVEPFPDRQLAISFFSALRFYYRKQLRLVEQGETPTLWYFDQLDFLRDYLFSNRKIHALEIILNNKPQDESCENNESIECSSPLNMESSLASDLSCSSSSQVRMKNSSQKDEDVSMVDFEENEPSFQYFEDLAKTWATILRSVSPQQQVIAEKLINDVIYEAHMGKLDDQVPLDILNVLQTYN